MPKDKDLKKLVRARMAKTGERYSIAKVRVAGVGKTQRTGTPPGSESQHASTSPAIYQLKITVADIAPEIWRRVLVPADTSLARLHQIIQAAFGWLNYHLHRYVVDDEYFGDTNPEFVDELMPMTDERDATLRDIASAKAIVYEYDFGDNWQHLIEVENVAIVPEAGVKYPVCTRGARSRPPEDCGGVPGYEDLLEILGDPAHEEHASMKKWVGKNFAPERFDLAVVNQALQKIGGRSGRRRAAGGRTATVH
jgi:hypothetical protein